MGEPSDGNTSVSAENGQPSNPDTDEQRAADEPQGPPDACPHCGASLWVKGKNHGICQACGWPSVERPADDYERVAEKFLAGWSILPGKMSQGLAALLREQTAKLRAEIERLEQLIEGSGEVAAFSRVLAENKRLEQREAGRCDCRFTGEIGHEKLLHECQLHSEIHLRLIGKASEQVRADTLEEVRGVVEEVRKSYDKNRPLSVLRTTDQAVCDKIRHRLEGL